MKTQCPVFCLTIILVLMLVCSGAGADQLVGVSEITMAGGNIVSIRHGGTEYVVANGDLILGTTTRWYIPAATGVPTLWAEGAPAPAATVTGTSDPKVSDVGSKADNWTLAVAGAVGGMSSIDGINYQETVFPLPTKLIFVFERGGNDNGTVQPILLDGSLGASLPLKASGAPYANTGVNVGGQNAFGYALVTDAPVIGLRITASGHDAMSISAVPTLRRDPTPADEATDVVRDVVLSWTPGEGAVTYDVYFGTSLADVADASRANPKGALVSQGQTETTYTPAQRLQYGQVYYWRVDEIAAAPNSEVSKGVVWSFTAEPISYPITNIAVTASSFNPEMVPENTINRSGLNSADQHSVDPTHMWLSGPGAAQPTWIQYEFDKAYKLDTLQVWNSNQALESVLGFGAKDVTVECSLDGQTWTRLGDFQFPRAPGGSTYSPDEPVDFDGAIAKFVKLTINSNWGGMVAQYGLSEVRFFFVPVQAREPVPAVGATGVDLDAELNWRPGREAASHKVYFGKDAAAVTAGTAPAATVADHSFGPAAVEFGTTYYWRVDEVNNAETPSVYEGAVWNYTTREYAVIDDFEGYTDDEGSRIYEFWIDGVTDGKSGSTVGYLEAPFAERRIVHSGKQSMPLTYDNSASFSLSEAELIFDTPQNWTGNGADSFVLWFRGQTPAFAEVGNGNIIMNGIGADIWGTSDAFRLAYKTLNGDATIVARVESIYNSNAWAKGGVMIRQSIEPGSVHAFMPITPGGSSGGNGASFQRRLTTGGDSTNNDNTGAVVAAPYWVKLERKGNAFSGFISPDGKTWTQLGTAQTIPMTGPVLIGLALCSHDAAVATGAEFSNVAMTGNVTGSWQVAEIGVAQPSGNSAEGLYLSVKDNAGKVKVVQHPSAAATAFLAWQQWRIPLSEFTAAGVKMNAVKSLMIGVGNKAAPVKGGVGTVYIDDIGFGRPIQ